MASPRYGLSGTDVILRGCEREPPRRLLASMREHYLAPRTPPEWGLSVAAMPGATEAETLRAARQIRQSHYRVASVESILDLSDYLVGVLVDEVSTLTWLSVEWDHNAHGLILSQNEPTIELASAIGRAFGLPKVNPYYDERNRSRARR